MNLVSYLKDLVSKNGSISHRELNDAIALCMNNSEEKESEKSTLDTKIIIKAFDNKKLAAPIITSHNATVLNGRVDLQEFIFGTTPNPSQHLTLNQLLDIPHSVDAYADPELYRKRYVKWFCIGNGAESTTVNYDIIAERTSDTKLYNIVPFRCVKASADLSELESAKYRLRKQIRIKGQDYIAYYAKEFEKTEIKLIYNSNNYLPVESDTSTLPDSDPSKPLRAGTVLTFTTINIEIEEKDFKEFYMASNNGEMDNMAKISELGLIGGLDIENSAGLSNNKKEIASASLFAKMCISPVGLTKKSSSATFTYNVYS